MKDVVVIKIDFPSVIRVDFPALTDLVAYLRDQSDQQKKIEALSAQVEELNTKLSQSSTVLEGAVERTQK
jgi:chromosome condensin MukBEF ATPase and DNA-binding subunit MukB